MARRRYYGRRRRGYRGGFKIPIIPLTILAGQAFIANQSGSMLGKLARFGSLYTGIDASNPTPNFDAGQLLIGYGPWLAYGFIKKVVFPMANPNKALSRFHVPVTI